ncbi:unnamed protein product [Bemisia tabaci]|uniref:Dynein heavy chain ATP-binding dynein motor region domain-containing protein n=1 Tax=Bemisia tabaci TaxID=7038 RepID=A0A9P0F1V1_BEMTA|nr:unnamed protein product [Bemisia tabaci]
MTSSLTKQQNNFKIALKQLEDELLLRLSSAGGEVLSDKNLVLNLEQSKLMAKDIEEQVVEAKLTAAEIDKAREKYRTAATRASIIYFIMITSRRNFSIADSTFPVAIVASSIMMKSDLLIKSASLDVALISDTEFFKNGKAFSIVFQKAIVSAEPSVDIHERVRNLVDNITFMIFMYTSRGLFESDKLIFLAQMAIQKYGPKSIRIPESIEIQIDGSGPIDLDFHQFCEKSSFPSIWVTLHGIVLKMANLVLVIENYEDVILAIANEIKAEELDFVLRFPYVTGLTSPVDFLTSQLWGGIKALAMMDDFR